MVPAVLVRVLYMECCNAGAGDTTGYITAQPPVTAQYTYIHDTGITGAHILHQLNFVVLYNIYSIPK